MLGDVDARRLGDRRGRRRYPAIVEQPRLGDDHDADLGRASDVPSEAGQRRERERSDQPEARLGSVDFAAAACALALSEAFKPK